MDGSNGGQQSSCLVQDRSAQSYGQMNNCGDYLMSLCAVTEDVSLPLISLFYKKNKKTSILTVYTFISDYVHMFILRCFQYCIYKSAAVTLYTHTMKSVLGSTSQLDSRYS